MPDRIRALVVDDEALARTSLRAALSSVPGWVIAGECDGARAARAFLEYDEADVVFLDIQMPGESGLSLARALVETESPPAIVFVTAFDRYAIEAFEIHALDYVLKPFDDGRLAKTLARARDAIDARLHAEYRSAVNDAVDDVESLRASRAPSWVHRLCVRSVGSIESVDVSDVEWIRSAGNYVELHLASRVVLHRVTMAQLERRLDPAEFVRVHRSAIVRRRIARSLRVIGDGSYELTLDSGTAVPVSERHLQRVRSILEGTGRG